MLNLDVGTPVTRGDQPWIATRAAIAGHAVYGPYQRLPLGRYSVEFTIAAADDQRFDSDEVCAVVEVVSEFGKLVSASERVWPSQLRDVPMTIRLPFRVKSPAIFE